MDYVVYLYMHKGESSLDHAFCEIKKEHHAWSRTHLQPFIMSSRDLQIFHDRAANNFLHAVPLFLMLLVTSYGVVPSTVAVASVCVCIYIYIYRVD